MTELKKEDEKEKRIGCDLQMTMNHEDNLGTHTPQTRKIGSGDKNEIDSGAEIGGGDSVFCG